jgi:hypothetical protein
MSAFSPVTAIGGVDPRNAASLGQAHPASCIAKLASSTISADSAQQLFTNNAARSSQINCRKANGVPLNNNGFVNRAIDCRMQQQARRFIR